MKDTETISVVTADAARGVGLQSRLKVEELSVNVNLFLDQLGAVLAKAPQQVGAFHFAEFEVHAEVSAKGTLALLGTGGEASATGGLKFVFRRAPAAA